MFKPNPLSFSDGYKPGHKRMLAPGTTKLYGTWIPRSLKHSPHEKITKIVSAGQQHTWRWLHDVFEEWFFKVPENLAMKFGKDLSKYLGQPYDYNHFKELHKLGYLPIEAKALPEGIETDPNIPHQTFVNTHDDFAWLTLYLETPVSAASWKFPTSATIALQYRRTTERWVRETDVGNVGLIPYLCHDFSARGLDPFSMVASGLGHAFSFKGSDSLISIEAARYYYGVDEDDVCINSVNASEHSVSTTKIFTVGEKQMIIDWLKEFPKGILSIVADTFDLWKLLTEYIQDPEVKKLIMEREGKLVVRPDCYSEDTYIMTSKGWKLFKNLDPNTDLVAQVLDDGTHEFVRPQKYYNKPYKGDMIRFYDHHGKVDLLVTPNHRMIYDTKSEDFKVKEAKDCKFHWENSIRRSSEAIDRDKTLTELEALKIAFQADGSYTSSGDKIRFSFSKKRKLERLEDILHKGGWKYITYTLKDGRTETHIDIDSKEFDKNFNWVDISSLCSNWCKEFINELSYWDATRRHEGRFKFDTSNKEVMDVVELIAMSAGYGILISRHEDNRKDIFSDIYTAHILTNNKSGGQSIKKEIIDYDGNVYCVKVPTGRLLVKRGRGTAVCGNSGDPADIICGYGKVVDYPEGHGETKSYIQGKTKNKYFETEDQFNEFIKSPEHKGVIEILWDAFGGTTNSQGYKVLDPHIGAIYGDSITLARQEDIYSKLADKGFASTNIVLGVGSYTYQYNTRDTFGFAAKGAWFLCDGVGHDIYKDPITDDGTKTSLKGKCAVLKDEIGNLYVKTKCTDEEESTGYLRTIYKDGKFYNTQTLYEIRNKIDKLALVGL